MPPHRCWTVRSAAARREPFPARDDETVGPHRSGLSSVRCHGAVRVRGAPGRRLRCPWRDVVLPWPDGGLQARTGTWWPGRCSSPDGGTVTLPECFICRRPCIPMADYELPTCIRCDRDAEAILTRAGLLGYEERPVAVPAAPYRPYGTYFGPADPDVIASLVAALFPAEGLSADFRGSANNRRRAVRGTAA